MRISAGTARGRKIGYKKSFLRKEEEDELRPTSSKVREALFDIIRSRLPGAVFLDLYAGTGGVGIEALSRGASKAVFVESGRLRVSVINDLLQKFNFSNQSVTVNMNAYDFVKREAAAGTRYDIVFLDPPYHSEELMKVLPVIGEGDILEGDGMVIAEHFFKMRLPDAVNRLRVAKSYKYGDTVLTVYRIAKTAEEAVP